MAAGGGGRALLSYDVTLDRVDESVSAARTRQAAITVGTGQNGRVAALNPAELLLAAVGACMLKNIERVAPLLKLDFSGVHIELHGERRDVPPGLARIDYRILLDTEEEERRLELLHRNLRQYGTVFNTVAPGTMISGTLSRGPVPAGRLRDPGPRP